MLREHHDGIVFDRVRGEPARKPCRQFTQEQGIGYRLVDDTGAGVQSGLDAMAANDGLAESMDRRGGELVKPGCRRRERRVLSSSEAVREHGLDEVWDVTHQKPVHGLFNSTRELACCELRKGDRSNVPRVVAARQHHRDAPRHQRGFPRTGRGFDQ